MSGTAAHIPSSQLLSVKHGAKKMSKGKKMDFARIVKPSDGEFDVNVEDSGETE